MGTHLIPTHPSRQTPRHAPTLLPPLTGIFVETKAISLPTCSSSGRQGQHSIPVSSLQLFPTCKLWRGTSLWLLHLFFFLNCKASVKHSRIQTW